MFYVLNSFLNNASFLEGSKEELSDLQAAYLEFEGDMDAIMDNIMCCTAEDEPRFSKIINSWIKSKEVPNFKTFSKEKKAKKIERKARVSKSLRQGGDD